MEPTPISRAEFIRKVREDCNRQLEYTPEQALLRVLQEKTVEKERGQEKRNDAMRENTQVTMQGYNERQASIKERKQDSHKRLGPIYSAKDAFGNTPLDVSTYSEIRTPRRGSVRETLPLVSKEKIENIEQFPYERVRMEELRKEEVGTEESKKEHQVINFGTAQQLRDHLLTEQELKANRSGLLMEQLRKHPKLRWLAIRTALVVIVFCGIVAIDKLNIQNEYISGERIQGYVANNVTMEQLEEKVSWFVGEKVVPVFKGIGEKEK